MSAFADLNAVYVNTSLETAAGESHNWLLMNASASMSKHADGLPNEGHDRTAWKAGRRFGFENPEYRS
jgi:hypothetical protein